MATPKRLGGAVLAAATPVNIVSGKDATFILTFTNSGTGVAKIKASFSTSSATIQAANRVLPDDFELGPGEVVDKTGLAISSAEFLVVESDIGSDVNAVAYGWEE